MQVSFMHMPGETASDKMGLQHLFGAFIAFVFNELGELRFVVRIAHHLLLAAGAREIQVPPREGEGLN